MGLDFKAARSLFYEPHENRSKVFGQKPTIVWAHTPVNRSMALALAAKLGRWKDLYLNVFPAPQYVMEAIGDYTWPDFVETLIDGLNERGYECGYPSLWAIFRKDALDWWWLFFVFCQIIHGDHDFSFSLEHWFKMAQSWMEPSPCGKRRYSWDDEENDRLIKENGVSDLVDFEAEVWDSDGPPNDEFTGRYW